MKAPPRLLGPTAAGLLALLLSTPATFAQGSAATGEDLQKFSAVNDPAKPPARAGHRLVLQVAANEPGTMNLALNNANNVAQHYRASGEKVEIEIVVYGPGLHMLRGDTSPVKSRITAMSQATPDVSFLACANTQDNMQKQEAKEIPLVPEAKVVKSGIVRIMERQEQGWTYVRP